MLRHSGLQKDVLNLYRKALRVARKKDGPSSFKNFETVKTKFRSDAADVDRKDFRTIEFMLRQGTRRIEELESADVARVSVFKIKR
ncbi:Succinate dehydrogenase assembly factor 1, mitochondrial [Hondaea fermentalgiana]|uniref:Succinate dehydrogenase assembly factor 1, mitochondrial n=1 Tax=Hondaea fermentalgiana TaxID=2315210 RepID=A0A2R5H246_9STRA|nr:Succinate dehydrogenase assembly factor 1, mitochondrial [Hondaea fermentalgiana]|eukprot:GBG34911.1 Succinate dehydrogenase assembly factor 1, mitochondrial [Hondaea fermentalgiana]